MSVAHGYAYRAVWSQEDDAFIGKVAELPSLSWISPDQNEALRGIKHLAVQAVDDLNRTGEPVPRPLFLYP